MNHGNALGTPGYPQIMSGDSVPFAVQTIKLIVDINFLEDS